MFNKKVFFLLFILVWFVIIFCFIPKEKDSLPGPEYDDYVYENVAYSTFSLHFFI